MKILIVSQGGDGLGIAQRLALEGNDVGLWIQDERYAKAGTGHDYRESTGGRLVRVAAWEPGLAGAELVVADCVGLGRYVDRLADSGVPYLGFNPALDHIEVDRQKGMELFERAGLALPETIAFNSAGEADAVPQNHGWGEGWVLKPSGNAAADLTQVVRREELWDESVGRLPADVKGVAQRLVSGIEVSTEGWFNGEEFLHPFNHTFEEKRFLAGGLGVNTGCQGNVVIQAGDGNKLTAATVEPLADFLAAVGYRGPLDINAIVTADAAYVLECTSRMGFDAIEALVEALDEPFADMLLRVAQGESDAFQVSHETAIAVRLSIPPYPSRAPDRDKAGAPVLGITDEALNHLFLCDLYRDRQGVYRTAGADGILLKATALGNVRDQAKPDITYNARRRVYRTLDRIEIEGKQYRTDIGARVNDDVAQLKVWGWLD